MSTDFCILSTNFLILLSLFPPLNGSCLSICLHEVPFGDHFSTLDPTWLLFCISQIQYGCL